MKTPAQMREIAASGLITARALDRVRQVIAPGITTRQIDQAAREVIEAAGAKPNFAAVSDYGFTTCISVNEQVIHGRPADRVIAPGDIVSVDCGAELKGWHSDSAITVVVPDPARPELVAARESLSAVTRRAMWAGIAAFARGKRISDISAAIEDAALASGECALLTDYVGHGIGQVLHEAPEVPNYRTRSRGPKLVPGLVLAIEPMLVAGQEETAVADDGWTVYTVDGSDGAHWEHTVCLHERGIWVCTLADGGKAELADFGIEPVFP